MASCATRGVSVGRHRRRRGAAEVSERIDGPVELAGGAPPESSPGRRGGGCATDRGGSRDGRGGRRRRVLQAVRPPVSRVASELRCVQGRLRRRRALLLRERGRRDQMRSGIYPARAQGEAGAPALRCGAPAPRSNSHRMAEAATRERRGSRLLRRRNRRVLGVPACARHVHRRRRAHLRRRRRLRQFRRAGDAQRGTAQSGAGAFRDPQGVSRRDGPRNDQGAAAVVSTHAPGRRD